MRRIKRLKRDTWKQENPRDQFVAIMSAIEGHRCNLEDGDITIQYYTKQVEPLYKQLKELSDWLPPRW